MKIAFCTTCKGRTPHIEQTLPKNLLDNAAYKDLIFIILDYNSPDHLLEYLRHHPAIRAAIDCGRVIVYSHTEPGPFKMSHAKNMAHRLAMRHGADVLVNLDADNYTGTGFAEWVACQYRNGNPHEFFLWCNAKSVVGRARQGLAGRIGMSTNVFLKVGGYDERYSDWAPEDDDLKARIRRLGYQGHEIPNDYLYVIPHKDGLRFKEYPHAKPTPEQETAAKQRIHQATNVIANYGRMGLGSVLRNFNHDELVEIKPLPTRIHGIGMHKTATTSLNTALNILGFDAAHWVTPLWAKHIWQEMNAAERSITLERHYAVSDLPMALLYERLDKAYPGSKFILTIRDEQKWLNSVRKHWDPACNPWRTTWDNDAFSNRVHQILYGRTTFDAAVMLARYRKHNADVRKYFASRPADLLVMDMDKGAGYRDLCRFLDKPVPKCDYPKALVTGGK